MDWWIEADGQRLGPYTREQIHAMTQADQIPSDARIWDPRGERWLPAEPHTNGTAIAALGAGIVAVLALAAAFTITFAFIPVVIGTAAFALAVVARRQITSATPPEPGYGMAITGMALGILAFALGLAIPALMLLMFDDGPTTACRTEVESNLRAAAVAQETVRARQATFATDPLRLQTEGSYRPIAAGACATTPDLVIVYADPAGFCMQMSADGRAYSVRPEGGVLAEPC